MTNILKFLVLTLLLSIISINSSFAQNAKKVNMKKPDKVALAFMQRLAAFDFDGAKELCTEESHSMLDFMSMAIGMQAEEELSKAKIEAKENSKNLTKATCKKNKEKANCTFCCDLENKPMTDSEIQLKKVKGKWYVHMSKEEMMNDMPQEMPALEEDRD